jgi:hypothetical protein
LPPKKRRKKQEKRDDEEDLGFDDEEPINLFGP